MNKTYPKRRSRGRPKKRKGKDRFPKRKETSERDDEEEEIKATTNVVDEAEDVDMDMVSEAAVQVNGNVTPIEEVVVPPSPDVDVCVSEKEEDDEVDVEKTANLSTNRSVEFQSTSSENPDVAEAVAICLATNNNEVIGLNKDSTIVAETEDDDINVCPVIRTKNSCVVTQKINAPAVSQTESNLAVTQAEKISALTQTEKNSIVIQRDKSSAVCQTKKTPIISVIQPSRLMKEEKSDDESQDEESMQLPSLSVDMPASTSSSSTSEAVVAQLNQLQETVVSHILQYQAGVMAQFQQLQQQMLSELNSGNQPQVTVTPVIKREPSGRKRKASKLDASLSEDDSSKNGEVQAKRKRTAFSEKQYEILETTFQHNNFPEPIDQHCIALRIKTPYRSIKMWFQNRRASIRKRMLPKEKEEEGVDKKSTKNCSDPDTRWYCSLCPSTFICKKFLDSHKEAHEKTTLNCTNCNMTFTHKVLLDTHKISKCTSISGVDLSHLEDERKELHHSQDKINFIKALSKDPKSSESTTVSAASLPLLLQKFQKQQPKKEDTEPAAAAPTADPSPLGLPTITPKPDNQLFVQQQQLMQQLLLAQLQQAAQVKAKQESIEEQETTKETENPNGSLTLGGLTIFPVKSTKGVEIKEEVKQTPQEEFPELQPSTIQDQITSILHSQGMKAAWKSDDDEESKTGSRESMKEQIQAILRHQEEQRKKTMKLASQATSSQEEESMDLESLKRHRRRTTVFNEVQLRTLYMHFTHCNFPDPAMFKIIGHLVKLDPQVIKIWFQNERSRQRKRAMHIVDEVSAKDKPYKCKDCGMSFAMMTFLVKHSMRHIGETDQAANVRTCPLCLQKWNKEVFTSHLKSRHNVNLSLIEERNQGSLKCYLCSEIFPDQENLMIHKHKHLKDEYGDPPQCSKCKTTFVNAICLEAHMETHEISEWAHKCSLCDAMFHDKVLLTSHEMGHGVPLAPVSTIDRSRSQLQHSNIKAINALARKTVASAIECLGKSENPEIDSPENSVDISPENLCKASPENSEEPSTDSEIAKSEKSILSIKTNMLNKMVGQDPPVSKISFSKSTSTNTPTISTMMSPTISPTIVATTPVTSPVSGAPVGNMMTPPNGPVSYVKLIPVQLIPTSPVPNSQAGSTPTPGVITGPTTAFISVPVNFLGTSEIPCSSIFGQILDPSNASKVAADDKNCKKKALPLPNLIPISDAVSPKKEEKIETGKSTLSESNKKKNTSLPTLKSVEDESANCVPDSSTNMTEAGIHKSKREVPLSTKGCDKSSPVTKEGEVGQCSEVKTCEEKGTSMIEEPSLQQAVSKKRYVPILPLLPAQSVEKDQKITTSEIPSTPVTTTPAITTSDPVIPQRPKSSRNVPNKRLWEAFKVEGYKRRRTPTYFSGDQREILEAHFDHDNFPDPGEQVAIADQLVVDYPVVKTWFQNTRKNFRKQLKFEKVSVSGGPFHCQKCNVAFISEASLAEHSEVHSNITGIRCDGCDLNFAHDSVQKTHQAVYHKTGKLSDSTKRKKYMVDMKHMLDVLGRYSSQGQYDGDNEDMSDSNSEDDEGKALSVKKELVEISTTTQKGEKVMEDSLDGEDYHPIMAVECILDNSDEEEVQKPSNSTEASGHKCLSCEESFASFIALKEHVSHHCSKLSVLKPGHFRRRRGRKPIGRRKDSSGNIRCSDCNSVFSERNAYLEHFRTFPCVSGRQRIEYTVEEQKVLCTHYDGNNFPLPSEMSLLARRLGVRYRQVMHWFQNRRSKERKKLKEGGKTPPVECPQCKASFVTDENLSRHQKIVHGDENSDVAEESSPTIEHVCTTPGCGAFFPNAELLLTHSLAHQIDSDAAQTEEESNSHKLPNLGPTSLWKDFAVLEAHYSDNNFPDPMDIGFIARRLQVDPLHVHLWFKERRNQHIRKLEENGSKVMEGETAVSTQKALSKVCSKCDAAFICQADLESHEEMHKSSWAQVCSMCEAEFSNVVVLETHWIRHGIEVSKDKRQSPDRPTKISFTNSQMEVLDTHYEHNNFPMALEIWLIAIRLNLRPRQVTHWFQNKRGRDRRVHKLTSAYSRLCLHCGASFICDEFLGSHTKIHKCKSRFPCTECGAIYLSSVLLETHTLYHNSVPKDKFPRKTSDGVRDPMTEGQMKVSIKAEDAGNASDSSEGELRIDESEDYAIGMENNDEEVDAAEIQDEDYEPVMEENDIDEGISSAGGTSDQPGMSDDADQVSELRSGIGVQAGNISRLKAANSSLPAVGTPESKVANSPSQIKLVDSLQMETEDYLQNEVSDNPETVSGVRVKCVGGVAPEIKIVDSSKTEVDISPQVRAVNSPLLKTDGVTEVKTTDGHQTKAVESLQVKAKGGSQMLNVGVKKVVPVREEVFFDDNTSSDDDDEDEPRLRIVSAYAMTGEPINLEIGDEEDDGEDGEEDDL